MIRFDAYELDGFITPDDELGNDIDPEDLEPPEEEEEDDFDEFDDFDDDDDDEVDWEEEDDS
jgi:hypothetical protein